MADEAAIAAVEPVVEPVIAPIVLPAPVEDETGEPGGSDPQAVRARKEYRARRAVEVELRQEREARIASESRLRALEEREQRQPTPTTQRKFSPAEIQAAVDAGTVSLVEAADYLARSRAEETAERVLTQERTRVDVEERQSRALGQVNEYTQFAPWITDKTDARFRNLEVEYQKLTDPNGLYRLPQSPATDLLVLEQVLGPIASLRRKADVQTRNDTHVEASAGGAPVGKPQGASDFSKMPKHWIDFWEKTGTSLKDREDEMKRYRAREAAKK